MDSFEPTVRICQIYKYKLREMARNIHPNPYIDLISSDSDQPPTPPPSNVNQHSSHPHPHPLSQTSTLLSAVKPHPPKGAPSAPPIQQRRQPSYEDVCNFKNMMETVNLTKHYYQLRDFLQNKQKNVLFLFGPSGCGKTLLVQYALSKNSIPYSYAVGQVLEDQEGELLHQSIFDIIYKELGSRSMLRESVTLFKEFPAPSEDSPTNYLNQYKIFRQNIYDLIRNSHNLNKYLFILNTEIYSPFYLLSENSQERALQPLPNVSIIKMEPYGIREMEKIINHFVSQHPYYSSCTNNAKVKEDIILEANGDARKAFNIIYHHKLLEQTRKLPQLHRSNRYESSSLPSASLQKQEQKVTVFHMLGKFLYGKRANIYHDRTNRKKKDNDVSAYYSEQQLARLDPKFYFQPVELLDRSRMAFPVFVDLLEQNFLNRYGQVKDIAQMYRIFRYYDTHLDDCSNRYETQKQMETIIKQLLTWGILIYNKNTVRQKGLCRIQRSKNNLNKKLRTKKIQILRAYYLRPHHLRDSLPYRLSDLLQFAAYTKTQHYKTYCPPLHQKLIELVNDSRRSALITQAEVDSKISVIQGEEEDMAKQNCSSVNQIEVDIAREVYKKSRVLAIVMGDSDGSDIDSID